MNIVLIKNIRRDCTECVPWAGFSENTRPHAMDAILVKNNYL